MQRCRLAAGKIALGKLVQAGRGKIDRKFGAAQNDLGQLAQLVRLLVANDAVRRKMARQPERHCARNNERRKWKVRSLESHPVREEFRRGWGLILRMILARGG
ncbi:hypothetical protein TM239_16840 [Bradyrhizobium sp. TM239]|nr:hypothetical protein TM239_16840 [Bradyrhizobium sp. TM239]